MKITQFDYSLPKNLIAHSPIQPRDHSRLLVVDKNTGLFEHKYFWELMSILGSKDVLVLNNTKVFPARLIGRKEKTGGKVEILLIEKTTNGAWSAMYKGKLKVNQKLLFSEATGTVTRIEGNLAEIDMNVKSLDFNKFLMKAGITPLPPYIKPKNKTEKQIRDLYQTVYAHDQGSVAAPTAGFHFTKELLNDLAQKGIQIEYVTLHVGLGTFLPIHSNELKGHPMHAEKFYINKSTADRLNKAKILGKRIIAVGTTTARALESMANNKGYLSSTSKEKASETSLFIYPPYKFKFIDALITNFHLPKSTLLALVAAFTSYPNTNCEFTDFSDSIMGKAYSEAISNKYRFYSFGDACLIK